MSDATTQPPADVRDRIIRASILPFEDEETMIAGLRAGAEAVERGELDVDDFVGVWSQYLRELFRRASSVPAPVDVREQVKEPTQAQIDDACMWYRHDFGLLSEKERDSVRFEARQWFRAWGKALSNGDDYAALLRTTRGEGEAKFDVGDPAALRLAASKLEASGYDVLALRLRKIADQIKCVIAARRSKAQGDAKALAALVVHIWRRCKNEGPHYRETDEFWADFERAYELALLRTPRGEGEEDGGEFCDLCGEMFDPSELGTVIGPLGEDDGVPRWYRCPRCARAYDAGYQQGQRDPRGDETADPTAPRSDAQGEDQWEDLVFGPITQAYNDTHAARPGEGGGDGD